MRSIKRRTHQIVHAGIHYQKFPADSLFYIENLCNQRSALCNYRPAELAVYLLSGRKVNAGNQSVEIISEIRDRILIGVVIINSKTSPDIYHRKFHTTLTIVFCQRIDTFAQQGERFRYGYLGSYVKMKTDKVDPIRSSGEIHSFVKASHINTELIFFKSCGDILVGMGIYIRIDTKSHRHLLSATLSEFTDDLQFLDGFHIETADTTLYTKDYFSVSFSDTGIIYGVIAETCRQSRLYLSSAHTIRSETGISYNFEYLRIAVCLYRIMHVHVTAGYTLLDFIQRGAKKLHIIIIKRG